MIIEFTGVPCSGKSDISHELAQMLGDQGVQVCQKQYELSHGGDPKKRALKKATVCLCYCLTHPKRAIRYYRMIGSMRNWLNYIYLLSHNCKKEVCILEQGYLQLIASFFDNNKADLNKMEFLMKSLVPKTDIVQVFVWASKETVLDRAASRADKPFFMGEEDPAAALDLAFASCENLKQIWCENKGEAKFISVSNEKENAQREVAKTILEIMKQKEILCR